MGVASARMGRGHNETVVAEVRRRGCSLFGLEEMSQFLSREGESKKKWRKDEMGEKGTASGSENRERSSWRGGLLKWYSSLSPVLLGRGLAHLPVRGRVG